MNTTLSSIATGILAVLIFGIAVRFVFFSDITNTNGVVFVTPELGISGKIVAASKSRGYRIYLGASRTPYNVDAYKNAQVAPHNGLGYYAEMGDIIEKKPNSTTLTLTRNGVVSQWQYVPPRPAE
jgi:hypothetical protein